MKQRSTFYVKIITLYILIFISFLVKTHAGPNFSDLIGAVKDTKQFGFIVEVLHTPITSHQAR